MELPKFDTTEQLAIFLKSLPRQMTEAEVGQHAIEHDIDDPTPTERLGIYRPGDAQEAAA